MKRFDNNQFRLNKLLIILVTLIVSCYSANAQNKARFDAMLDLSYSFSMNANKYNSGGIGGTAGVLLLNDWLFLGGGAKFGFDKYEFPLVKGKYTQATIYADARLYIPLKNDMARTYLDFKIGTSGADPKFSKEDATTITTYKDLILGGPYRSLGLGIRIPVEGSTDVGLGFYYDYYELTIKRKKEPILGAGVVENFMIKLEWYF
jgi:hypothetical protein